MKRTMKYALSAVLGVMLVAPAFAQDVPFPDTNRNMWAFEAIDNLAKHKIIVGYPDGYWRGNRMATRNEVAQIVHNALMKVMGMFDGVNDQIKALQDMIKGMPGGDANALKDLRDQLNALKSQVDGMKGWGAAVADLQKLTKEFERELTEMGVKVDDVTKQLADVNKRLDEIDKRKPALDMHGYVTLWAGGGFSNDNDFGILPDGTITGYGDGSYAGAPVGATRDLHVRHQFVMDLETTADGPVKGKGTLVYGNFLSSFGSLSDNFGGFLSEGEGEFYFDQLYAAFNSSIIGQGFNAEVGRVSHEVGPYLWRRTDLTKSYLNDRMRGDHKWRFDGAKLGFNFGAANLMVFGGKNSDLSSNDVNEINPISLGNGLVDQTLGVQLMFPIGEMGGVNLAYLWHDSNTQTPIGVGQTFNRLNVYGAELNLKFDNIGVWAAYSASVLSDNTSTRLDDDNAAWDVALRYAGEWGGVRVGYRRVEENFSAAGDWGRLGIWYNPTNIEGFNGKVWFQPTKALKVYASGEFVEGIRNSLGSPIGDADNINMFKVGLDYNMSNGWMVGLGYEDTRWDYNVGTDPVIRFYNVDLGYNLSDNAAVKIFVIYSDADNKGRGLFGISNRHRGGLIGTQLTIKY